MLQCLRSEFITEPWGRIRGFNKFLKIWLNLSLQRQGMHHLAMQIMPCTEPTQKIELMPNDIKLKGIKNYLSWSRRALLILKTKGLENIVEEESTEPADKTSAEWRTWSTTNSLVVAWLLNSLSSSIAATVETISSASEVWKTLSKLWKRKCDADG